MKYLSLILFGLFISFMTSCSDDNLDDTSTDLAIDFSGTYVGTLDCEGAMSENDLEDFEVIITKGEKDKDYQLDFGDEVIFVAEQRDQTLRIEEQILNANQDFDVIRLEGLVTLSESGSLILEIEHEVDDEGISNCEASLIKQ